MNRVGLVAALTATALTLSTTQALAEPSPIPGIETNLDISDSVAISAQFDPADGRDEDLN